MAEKTIETPKKECNNENKSSINQETIDHILFLISDMQIATDNALEETADEIEDLQEDLDLAFEEIQAMRAEIDQLKSIPQQSGPYVYNIFESIPRKGGLPLEYAKIKGHLGENQAE